MNADRRPNNEARLRSALDASHDLGRQIAGDGFPLAQFDTLQAFQLSRLKRTYADLATQPQYQAAVVFFLDELYGGLHFRERDRQVEKVLPTMVRLLPDHMLGALADAFRLQGLSIELDIRLCREMQDQEIGTLDDERYAAIYRVVPRPQREEQLRLIHALGLALCRLVRHRVVLFLIRAMRAPAHAAGFGPLQQFLESGLSAFRAMGDGGPAFVQTIQEREARVMRRLYAGIEDPFRS